MCEFIDIPNIPSYKINEYGVVISYKRSVRGKKLNPYTDKDGYHCIKLQVSGTSKGFKVHRLVALAFISNPEETMFINHIDGNKLNNHYTNLEWCTNTHNQRHAWRNDLKTIKLTVSDVKEIKQRINNKESNTSISKLFNVDQTLISNIKTGKIWNKVFKDE